MEESKLWLLARSLPPGLQREAGRWVNSPFFNRKPQVRLLWAYLQQLLKSNTTAPQKVEAYRAAFPSEQFDISKLRLAMSDLYKLLLHFIAYQEWQKETMAPELYQTRYLRRAGLDKLARQQLKQGEKTGRKSTLKNADHLRYTYELMAERYILDSRSRPADTRQLERLSQMADQALLSAKLRQACLSLAHRSVYTAATKPGFTELAITYIDEAGLKKEPAIGLYYYCYHMLKEPSKESYFQHFKRLLFEHSEAFPASEIRELHLMGINFCIQQVNQGSEPYFDEIMAFYKKGLAEGYLLENGVLSRFTYYNIVAAGLRTGQFGWVEQFIHDYRSKLDRYYRESSFSFCLARLEYARQSYDAALPLLQKANYRDPLLNLSAKTLLLKIYFETDEYDLLSAHLDAMSNYIRRKRVIGYHKTNYLNIIRYARKLMMVNPFDKKAQQELSQQIEKEEVLTERRWLLEQIMK